MILSAPQSSLPKPVDEEEEEREWEDGSDRRSHESESNIAYWTRWSFPFVTDPLAAGLPHPKAQAVLGRGAQHGPTQNRPGSQTGAHLALVGAGGEEETLWYVLALVVYTRTLGFHCRRPKVETSGVLPQRPPGHTSDDQSFHYWKVDFLSRNWLKPPCYHSVQQIKTSKVSSITVLYWTTYKIIFFIFFFFVYL